MKKNEAPKPAAEKDSSKEKNPEGYPLYPPSEDIYNKFIEVKDIDPEDVLDHVSPTLIPEPENDDTKDPEDDEVKELGDHIMGSGLDVPGSEEDDEDEDIGNEDEENNYYSIGGDNHTDLEEDKGE